MVDPDPISYVVRTAPRPAGSSVVAFWDAKVPKYDYQPKGELVFVRDLPPFEVSFRDRPDGYGHTWSRLSRDAQIRTFGSYFSLAQQAAGWSATDLRAGFELARRVIARVREQPERETISSLRFGQRLATGIAKIAFSRARERRLAAYFEVGPCPYPHLNPWDLSSDPIFCHLRLAGMNPVLVETAGSVDHVEACMPVAAARAEFERGGHGPFDAALAERRVVVVPPQAFAPLAVLRPAAEPEHPHERRFFCQPTAVFVRRRDEVHLRPIGIRCHPTFQPVTPAHGPVWERAKLHYQVADSLYHTFVSHLPHTHFLMEPVIIAARRAFGHDHVGIDHPIRRLLEPHLEGTMAVNRVAHETLLDGSSSFLEFVASDVASTGALMSAAFRQRATRFETTFDAHALASDPDLVYPYRDDFAAVGGILEAWVSEYVDLHYRVDDDVRLDGPLQRWSRELRDPGQGRLVGLWPLDGIGALKRMLATVVRLATVQHAAFHFPQTDLGRLAYVIPFYAADVAPGQAISREQSLRLVDSLPDLHAAAWQSFVLGQSDLRWGTLNFLHRHFGTDGPLGPLVSRLRTRLAAAEEDIRIRNAALVRDGLTPYAYLMPSKVPCSINT